MANRHDLIRQYEALLEILERIQPDEAHDDDDDDVHPDHHGERAHDLVALPLR